MTPTHDQLQLFKTLFCRGGQQNFYGTYFKDSGRYLVRKEPVTDEVITRHLRGEIPLGVFPLVDDRTPWVVADFDSQDTKPVAEFVKSAESLSLSVYVERSKGKGWHCWAFFEETVHARAARQVFRHILDLISQSGIEVFPKQDILRPGEFGNFVNLPLFGELAPQGRTVFVDPTRGFNPYADQWTFLKTINLISGTIFDAVATRLADSPRQEERQNEDERLAPAASPLSMVSSQSADSQRRTFGLLPCSERILREGVTQMQRVSAFRLAVSLKKAGLDFGSTLSVLFRWSRKNRPEEGKTVITQDEIHEQVQSAYSRPYGGTGCNDPAITPFCSSECILRRNTSARKPDTPPANTLRAQSTPRCGTSR